MTMVMQIACVNIPVYENTQRAQGPIISAPELAEYVSRFHKSVLKILLSV